MKIHIVQKGDTLWKIAKKYGVNFEELKMLNSQLSNPDMIMPGMKIKVPTAGGNIKKETPIAGSIKEMPKSVQPIVKEKPITMPIVEKKPVKEMPVKEAPKKEMPKEKPFVPKMPTPIIPEIDIHNYYSMNMTNVDVDIDIEKPVSPPKVAPVLPKEEPKTMPVQEELCPPIIPYQPYCVSPMMPGSGFPPGVMPQTGTVAPMEDMPFHHGPMPGVTHAEYKKWEEESSSSSSYMSPQPAFGQHDSVAGAFIPSGTPKEYYAQPLVQYGQMPVEEGYMSIPHYKPESSSDFMGTHHHPPMQMPVQLPYKEDCGCGGTSKQPMHSGAGMMPMQPGFGSQMGPTPMPEGFNPGAGMMPMQPGFGSQMGPTPMPEGFTPGAGMMPMQPGFGPQMGSTPMPEGFNPGAGMMPMQPGFGPQIGPTPMPEGFTPGAGMMPMQPGFGPQMGSTPMPEGFTKGAGMMPMQPGFGPQMGPTPMPGNMTPNFPQETIAYPYPPGTEGNVPPLYPTSGEMQMPMGTQPETFAPSQMQEMTPPMFGPGGNAPIYTPPYQANVAQPPLMNPYGMNAVTPFGMPRYLDESSEYDN